MVIGDDVAGQGPRRSGSRIRSRTRSARPPRSRRSSGIQGRPRLLDAFATTSTGMASCVPREAVDVRARAMASRRRRMGFHSPMPRRLLPCRDTTRSRPGHRSPTRLPFPIAGSMCRGSRGSDPRRTRPHGRVAPVFCPKASRAVGKMMNAAGASGGLLLQPSASEIRARMTPIAPGSRFGEQFK